VSHEVGSLPAPGAANDGVDAPFVFGKDKPMKDSKGDAIVCGAESCESALCDWGIRARAHSRLGRGEQRAASTIRGHRHRTRELDEPVIDDARRCARHRAPSSVLA
jgi:hypothetical protein